MSLESATDAIGSLMAAFRAGDSQAAGRLIELFHPELKRLAGGHLRGERREHSWQPTLLVNELYLRLIRIKALRPAEGAQQDDKAAFFALAGQIMKRLLIQHGRLLSSKARKVPVWDDLRQQPGSDLLEVESLLEQLAGIKPEVRRVVEMKVFEGRTAEEIAAELGCSAVTVHRYWQFARRWLQKEWAV